MNVTICVPTIREDSIKTFLDAWKDEFASHTILVIEDNPTKTFKLEYPNVTHYSWKEIEDAVGTDNWIFPKRSSAIRSFGTA